MSVTEKTMDAYIFVKGEQSGDYPIINCGRCGSTTSTEYLGVDPVPQFEATCPTCGGTNEPLAGSSGADIVAAEQFTDSYRYLSGEKALMLAVLEDAIRCFRNQLRNPRHKPRLLSELAEEWIRADDWDWPFSFNNVCDTLRLEPAALRPTLLRSKAQLLAILKRRTSKVR